MKKGILEKILRGFLAIILFLITWMFIAYVFDIYTLFSPSPRLVLRENDILHGYSPGSVSKTERAKVVSFPVNGCNTTGWDTGKPSQTIKDIIFGTTVESRCFFIAAMDVSSILPEELGSKKTGNSMYRSYASARYGCDRKELAKSLGYSDQLQFGDRQVKNGKSSGLAVNANSPVFWVYAKPVPDGTQIIRIDVTWDGTLQSCETYLRWDVYFKRTDATQGEGDRWMYELNGDTSPMGFWFIVFITVYTLFLAWITLSAVGIKDTWKIIGVWIKFKDRSEADPVQEWKECLASGHHLRAPRFPRIHCVFLSFGVQCFITITVFCGFAMFGAFGTITFRVFASGLIVFWILSVAPASAIYTYRRLSWLAYERDEPSTLANLDKGAVDFLKKRGFHLNVADILVQGLIPLIVSIMAVSTVLIGAVSVSRYISVVIIIMILVWASAFIGQVVFSVINPEFNTSARRPANGKEKGTRKVHYGEAAFIGIMQSTIVSIWIIAAVWETLIRGGSFLSLIPDILSAVIAMIIGGFLLGMSHLHLMFQENTPGWNSTMLAIPAGAIIVPMLFCAYIETTPEGFAFSFVASTGISFVAYAASYFGAWVTSVRISISLRES